MNEYFALANMEIVTLESSILSCQGLLCVNLVALVVSTAVESLAGWLMELESRCRSTSASADKDEGIKSILLEKDTCDSEGETFNE